MARKKLGKNPTIKGITRSHLTIMSMLGPVEHRSPAELREAGATPTAATLLRTLVSRGFAEVKLLDRPSTARNRAGRTELTKCYRITGKGARALVEYSAEFDRLEELGERPSPPKRDTNTGRAPDVGRFRIHPWNGGGRGVA